MCIGAHTRVHLSSRSKILPLGRVSDQVSLFKPQVVVSMKFQAKLEEPHATTLEISIDFRVLCVDVFRFVRFMGCEIMNILVSGVHDGLMAFDLSFYFLKS